MPPPSPQGEWKVVSGRHTKPKVNHGKGPARSIQSFKTGSLSKQSRLPFGPKPKITDKGKSILDPESYLPCHTSTSTVHVTNAFSALNDAQGDAPVNDPLAASNAYVTPSTDQCYAFTPSLGHLSLMHNRPLAKQIVNDPPAWCAHYRVSQMLCNGHWNTELLNRCLPPSISPLAKQILNDPPAWCAHYRSWNTELLNRCLPPSISNQIQQEIPSVDLSGDDDLQWCANKSRKFTIASAYSGPDQFFKVEQKIPSWKPPAKPAFKLSIEVYHHADRTYAIGAAIVRNAEFQWFLGITRRIVSPCALEILLLTLKAALIQVWSYQLDHLEIDLDKPLIQELQPGPTECRSYLKTVISDIRDLLDR
ncbi:LOW QUALITY PROTEIN: hypothetical protein Cgig2_009378 [Carnegiea gigantea]|uniref:Uncharacterized protein n=1 Tax=Carnegiea gigantea TaxID=171969 RepID=A0A9Q1GJG5_9CARY|nr:LOW QUALITY PROTEIN: hypothetical protein Cgig2_009378 [Carnegiea gigantea]